MAKTISKTTILHLSILLAVLIIFISLPNASAAFPSDGLISYFKLDESGNTNVSLNSINPSLNGTGVGINSTNHVVGLINNGIYMYNGQYIRIDENAIFDFSDNFSISFWLTGNTTDTGWGQIISKDDCGSERSWNIFYVGGQFCAGLWNPTEQTLCNDTFIPLAGQFYNIVLSYNYINSSSSQAYLYINNALTAKNLTIGGAIKTTTDIADGVRGVNNSIGGDGLNCSNPDLSDYDKGACGLTDLTPFYFIAGLIVIAGIIAHARGII